MSRTRIDCSYRTTEHGSLAGKGITNALSITHFYAVECFGRPRSYHDPNGTSYMVRAIWYKLKWYDPNGAPDLTRTGTPCGTAF